jgi:uncharacterized protein
MGLRESDLQVGSQTLARLFVKDYVVGSLGKIRFGRGGRAKTDRKRAMTRREVLLAILAASQGRPYTPVQIQKATFLVTRNFTDLVNAGQSFDFVPYDYGPFDQNVYSEAEALWRGGEVEITRREGANWNQYAASDSGIERGNHILHGMQERQREYITRVSRWVRALSFEDLVRSIYVQYPEMRANSVFRG